MIGTNNSSQDYFLMFKNSVIALIFVVLIHMARNHFFTHNGFRGLICNVFANDERKRRRSFFEIF